jgi:hypothetical protein
MNLKAAHLVSIQFGIFIGIVCCLAFSRFEYFRPRGTSEKRAPITKRAAAVEPTSQSDEQTPDMEDASDPELAEAAAEPERTPLPNEYSAEAVERYRAEATRLYYEQIAPRRLVTTTVTTAAPTHAKAVQEPVVDQTYDPAPEPVAYVQPTPVIVYSQPVQYVAFSQPRRFANRCRPGSPAGAFGSNRDARWTHSNIPRPFERTTSPSSTLRRPPGSAGAGHHGNAGGSSCATTQGFASRGRR